MSLTVCVVPCHINEKKFIDQAIESFGEHATDVIYLGEAGNYNRIEHPNEWLAFIYSIEYIEEELRESFHEFLHTPHFDFYSVFKQNSEGRYFEEPRIFRAKIPIKRMQIYPENVELWRHERILNGMIKEQDAESLRLHKAG